MARGLEVTARLDFELPLRLAASEPPEARGCGRDDVRMLVTRASTSTHSSEHFSSLVDHLDAGDLVVINTSRTIPAAFQARASDESEVVVHLSNERDDGTWLFEPRRGILLGSERWSGPLPRGRWSIPGGGALHVGERVAPTSRLYGASFELRGPVHEWLDRYARPIRYNYVERDWPLTTYQNVFATEPGSVEMPSAGRAFTHQMVTQLVAKGVAVTPVVLHTGVASLEVGELPYPERVEVSAATAARVNDTRRFGHRVVAVGTTVVRALESSVDAEGCARPYRGWTEVVVTPERPARVVDALLTGWHEPVSSHLLMLEAFTGREILAASYRVALAQGYRWHEFGDLHLILP